MGIVIPGRPDKREGGFLLSAGRKFTANSLSLAISKN